MTHTHTHTPLVFLLCSSWTGDVYLARSISGDLVVQMKQLPCAGRVMCNKAARIRYGTSVITVDADQK